MSTTTEYEVEDPGQPNLSDGDGQVDDAAAGELIGQLPAVPAVAGWTAGEAARVVGGMVAGLTTVAYVMRYQQPPAPELMPHIAGDPEREFPLLGMSLAAILDLIAPKGSPAAIGVGLGAGLSELLSAVARRVPVLTVRPQASGPRPAPTAAAAPADEPAPGGFRFRPEDLEVLRSDADVMPGMGV